MGKIVKLYTFYLPKSTARKPAAKILPYKVREAGSKCMPPFTIADIIKSKRLKTRHKDIELIKSFVSLAFTQPREAKNAPKTTPANEIITAVRSFIELKYVSRADINTGISANIKENKVPLKIPLMFISDLLAK